MWAMNFIAYTSHTKQSALAYVILRRELGPHPFNNKKNSHYSQDLCNINV